MAGLLHRHAPHLRDHFAVGRVQGLADQLDLTAADHAVELWVGQVGAVWLRCRRMAMPGSKQLKCH